jgi:hypothetical protein
MAKKASGSKSNTANLAAKFANKTKRKRPGVHSKKKNSNLKSSKNYKKSYRGQG